MSTQGREFLILFLNTLFAIVLPVRSKLFKTLLVRSVAASGSMHFSVSLLLLKISTSKLGQSQIAFAMCYTPSSLILLLFKSMLLIVSRVFSCFMISLTWLSLIAFPLRSKRSNYYAVLKAKATTDSFTGFFNEGRLINRGFSYCYEGYGLRSRGLFCSSSAVAWMKLLLKDYFIISRLLPFESGPLKWLV
jgi:hypothetical protein